MRMTIAKVKRLREGLAVGRTFAELAKELGISEDTARRYATEESNEAYHERNRLRWLRQQEDPEFIEARRLHSLNYYHRTHADEASRVPSSSNNLPGPGMDYRGPGRPFIDGELPGMNKVLAKANAIAMRRHELTALEIEDALTVLGFYNITFPPHGNITAMFCGRLFTLEK